MDFRFCSSSDRRRVWQEAVQRTPNQRVVASLDPALDADDLVCLRRIFGYFSLAPILFHFQYDMESNGVVSSVAFQIALELLPFILVFVCWRQAARCHHRMQTLGSWLTLPCLLLNPFTLGIGDHVMRANASDQTNLMDHFNDASLAMKPQGQKPNLIQIYLESTERTLWDESLFGKAASPLKRLENRGFSATGIAESEMTNWTLAGHVASNCGTPLLGLGAIDRNDFGNVDALLPKAVCLSDILVRDGYNLTFMKGAKLEFAGTDGFVSAHSYQKGIGYEQIGATTLHVSTHWECPSIRGVSTTRICSMPPSRKSPPCPA